ncbi:MAG: hypothetical protein HKO92_11410 [Flavobacteriaceae bacterium]|nr:hypothetical protein [Flavobacteriaceae bacterium]
MTTELVRVELPGDRLYIDECRIQTFTYGDASALSLLPKTQDTQKLFEVIGRRINIPVKLLTLQDFWFIMYWQRINSYSHFPVKLPWTCPHCKTKNTDELTGSCLEINDLDDDYYHGIELDFPDIGPLKLRLKLVGDEIEAKRYIRENKINDIDGEIFEELLTACMLEPNGGSLSDRYNLVRQMSSNDQFLLKAFEAEFDYGVQSYSEFTCENEKCREVAKVSFTFDLANFFPSVQDKSNVRSRILSRKAPAPANRDNKRHGFDESSVHQGSPHKESKNNERKTETNESPSNGQEKIELTPEELQRLINEGVDNAIKDSMQEIEASTSLDDLTANR